MTQKISTHKVHRSQPHAKRRKIAGSDEILYLLHCSRNHGKLYRIVQVFFLSLLTPSYKMLTSLPFPVFHSCVSQILAFHPLQTHHHLQKVEDFPGQGYKTPTTKSLATHLQFRWKKIINQSFILILTGKTLALPFLAPPQAWMSGGQESFPTIHYSHSKWHISYSRKFLKSYKFRENDNTVSL